MKKKFVLWPGVMALIVNLMVVNPVFSGEMDRLVDKLVEKEVLSPAEADDLLQEMEAEQTSQRSQLPSWLQTIQWGGDLRLRHDTQWRDEETGDNYHRNRERLRLRLKMKARTSETTAVGVRLATGSGYQNTTNQSFDEHSRGKHFFIDRAYADWQPADYLRIRAGKHPNPLFTSSLVWDSDVNPEGVSESLTFTVDNNLEIFLHFGQWIVEELKVEDFNTDPTMMTCQIGSLIRLTDDIGLTVAATYYDFIHLDDLRWSAGVLGDKEAFLGYNHKYGQQMVFDKRRDLLNEYGCFELGAKVKMKNILPLPVSLFASFVKNLDQDIDKLIDDGVDPGGVSDPADLRAYGSDDRDQGWQIGFDIGSKKQKGDLYFQYLYQKLEDYAFPAVYVDSDFHGGGTNNKGHKTQLRYFLEDNMYLCVTGFFTEREDEDKDGKKDENRVQLDVIFQF